MVKQRSEFECKICMTDRTRCIVCRYCKQEKEVCVACGVRLLDGDALNVKCPNPHCLHTWNDEDVRSMKGIAKGVKRAFTERYEKALVQREIDTLESANYLIRRVDEELALKATLNEAKKQYKDAKLRVMQAKIAHTNILDRIFMEGSSKGSIMRCRAPVEENVNQCKVITECLGPIDEEAAYCLRCCTDVCLSCGNARWEDEIHVCSEEDCAALRELRLKSKPCPSCNIPIEKLEGCKVMFCTKCYTAFDWDSLEITHGRFHNPEHQRLVAAGILQHRAATGEGDNFLEFVDPPQDVGYPPQGENLHILYHILESILNDYKDELRRLHGQINYNKQLYARGMMVLTDFSSSIVALHKRSAHWQAVVDELRIMKETMQEHLQVVKEIGLVGFDGVMKDIRKGVAIVYNKIARNIDTIVKHDNNFSYNYTQFYTTIANAAPHILTTRTHPPIIQRHGDFNLLAGFVDQFLQQGIEIDSDDD